MVTILNRVLNVIGLQTKASKIGDMLLLLGTSSAKFNEWKYKVIALEGYTINPVAHMCVNLIADNVADIPIIAFKDNKQLETHPILDLLNRPNPSQSGMEFRKQAIAYFKICGNAFMEVTMVDDKPAELFNHRPEFFTIVRNKNGIISYDFGIRKNKVSFPVDPITGKSAILHLKEFNPLDADSGLSSFEAAGRAIDTYNSIVEENKRLIDNRAIPSGILSAEGGTTMSDSDREATKKALIEEFTGAEKTGRPMVVGGFKWTQLGLSPTELNNLEGLNEAARAIALSFQIPTPLLGITGETAFSNVQSAMMHLAEGTVKHHIKLLIDELNNWLVPLYKESGLRLDFNLEAISAMAPRIQMIAETVNASKIMTINEGRAKLQMSPLDDERGDRLINPEKTGPTFSMDLAREEGIKLIQKATTGSSADHTHSFEPGDTRTSVVNGHSHSIAENAERTGETNGHSHSL